jgi:AcrR family transcriptional regulator
VWLWKHDGGCSKIMRYPAKETAAKHDRIVKEASRLFRERGFENVSVGAVMKAAGLTHGAFYAHFASKQELQEAAVAYGQAVSLGRVQRCDTKKGKRSYADQYLSPCTEIIRATAAPWPHWGRRWRARRLNSKECSSGGLRNISRLWVRTGKKPSFKPPR